MKINQVILLGPRKNTASNFDLGFLTPYNTQCDRNLGILFDYSLSLSYVYRLSLINRFLRERSFGIAFLPLSDVLVFLNLIQRHIFFTLAYNISLVCFPFYFLSVL